MANHTIKERRAVIAGKSVIKARYIDGVTCELRFVEARLQNEPGLRSFAPHFHEDYQVVIAQHTTVEYWHQGRAWTAPTHSAVIFAPGEIHAARGLNDERQNAPLRTLFVAPELIERAATEGVPGFQLDEERHFFAGLNLHYAWAEATSKLQRDEALELWVSQFAARPAPRHVKCEHFSVRRAREFLRAHAKEEVSLQTLASHAGLSAFHLCRVFRTEVGVSPHEFQLQMRIESARALMRGGLGLREIALECGFADQSHFSREFKKRVGVSPGRYLWLAA